MMESQPKAYKVLVLYTELAQYFVSSLERFVERNNVEILMVRWPINKEAPFDLKFSNAIDVLERDELSDEELLKRAQQFAPNVVLTSGWLDKGYVKVCKALKKAGMPTVMCSDTKWTGAAKQRVAALLAPIFVRTAFSDVWVTGEAQKKYAKNLGYAESHIHTGFYSADVDHFKPNAAHLDGSKAERYPKRFLYMGRYIESKGIVELVNAFIELQQTEPNEWELWCCGTGELDPLPMEHESVKHFGFVQVKDTASFIEQTGVFVLPSHYEPWGVVVQEMAASGMPMLLSSAVGAGERFLEEGQNGLIFKSEDTEALKACLRKFMSYSDQQLLDMGRRSAELGMDHDPDKWSATLESILKRT